MELLPGVTIGDCGDKVGLQGVDNCFIAFNQVRIPRENLLNRFGDVLADGTYHSPLPTVGRRFAATVGELVGGRVGLSTGALVQLKTALVVATRYALQRRQFGPPGAPEVRIRLETSVT